MSSVVARPLSHPQINLEAISQEELLQKRICDLPLQIKGTWLEECIKQLYAELDAQGLNFHPGCYLADEWLTPQHETVIGIPFYLAHPRLIALERTMMLEAEGETKAWCMKLLRHEAGHAMSYAYNLHKRKKWQKLFGSSSEEYRETYRYKPYSKNFVHHLEQYYAQYHPDEDFVETFAVWLTPDSNWKKQYEGWKALEKLKYVDELMQEIQGQKPFVHSQQKFWRLSTLKITLATHYKKKKDLLAEEFPDFHDEHLKKFFSAETELKIGFTLASRIIAKYHKNILNSIATCTGERQYIISKLLENLQKRCTELRLFVSDSEPLAVVRITAYVTTLVMNYRYTGWFRGERKPHKS